MKKRKKNRVLRLLFIVLLFTLISTCMMTGTLAKYVTEGSGYDSARVARWGVVVNASSPGSGLFSTTYAKTDSTYAGTVTVDSTLTNGDNLVAPGTEGELTGFSITGTPEVACRITVSVDATQTVFTGWGSYEPILWTLSEGGVPVTGVSDVSFGTLHTALNAISIDVPPGTDLSTLTGFDYVISWKWPFSVSDAYDVEDTALGNATTPPEIALAFDITVTQID